MAQRPEGLRIFICGDVMTGRGIDQVLRHPSKPQLYEPYVKDARDYVHLAETVNGKIPRKVSGRYLWGDALKVWQQRQVHLKLINLETSITTSPTPWAGKGIHYRMHPKNIDAITSAKINVCALANNHVLDWGHLGLNETVHCLKKAGVLFAGAGANLDMAQKPATIQIGSHRVLIFSMGHRTSGIPEAWSATNSQSGVWLLDDLSETSLEKVGAVINRYRQPSDLCIVSIHWGGNWGYQIPSEHRYFAQTLIDKFNVHLIHGHSSHHPMGMEMHKGHPIFYGCGDFLNDYEGIGGHESFKSRSTLMYFLNFTPELRLQSLELLPLEIKQFQLHYANPNDCNWLEQTLKKHSPSSIEFNMKTT